MIGCWWPVTGKIPTPLFVLFGGQLKHQSIGHSMEISFAYNLLLVNKPVLVMNIAEIKFR